MIKIKEISNKNKILFVNDVKPSYLEYLKSIEKDSEYSNLFTYLHDELGKISDDKVEKILIGDIDELRVIIEKVGVLKKNDGFERLYKNFCSRKLGKVWGEKVGVVVCPYCNRSFIYSLKGGSRPQYDHFFPKSIYSYLAISMYNLIPSCSICNSLKKDDDTYTKQIIYPFKEEFGYDIFFNIDTKDDEYSCLGMSNNFEIKISFDDEKVDELLQEKVEHSNEMLHLEEFYNKHKDYAKKVLKNKYIYTNEYCQTLFDTYPDLFKNIDDLKNNLYLTCFEKEEWGNQILSKLTYDLLNRVI